MNPIIHGNNILATDGSRPLLLHARRGYHHLPVGMEKTQWEKLALMVPETLLLVGTSEGVLASIESACSLLGDDIWGVEDADDPDSPSNVNGVSTYILEFEVPLETTCGAQYTFGDDDDHSFGFGISVDTAGSGKGSFRFWTPLDTIGRERTFGVPLDTTGNVEHTDNLDDDEDGIDDDYWANTLASAFAPDGLLTAAHREITRLISLHAVAGHVLTVCVTPLGLQRGKEAEAAWHRRKEHRDVVVPRAHDALLRLSSATSATAAAEDFLRLRSAESSRRKEWPSEVKQLMRDAKRDVDEARVAVMLMRDAVVREFFETWTILKRAPRSPQACR
ncbi:hypothetical protein GUJ93_ZPchr0008g13097 [Zizania palustris]|uniref:Uncharacterized protein n=1 Tax=Zizania palustris TaxID=103762 RepID=A0A8J5QXN7_ZIZPA|nr:hypothetical protein GUJ93_ZPchr0008g13097 [Zizania palustris]